MRCVASALVEVQAQVRRQRGRAQRLGEGQVFLAAREHAQRERGAARGQRLRHGQQRRHADAAGQQQVVRGFVAQRKGVARRADRQQVALAHALVHRGRAAAARGLALHADDVDAATKKRTTKATMKKSDGRARQRVLPREAAGHVHVDVRPGLVRRQRPAPRVGQLEGEDFGRLPRDACDAHGQRAFEAHGVWSPCQV
jgi:hypothetical protein